MNRRLAPVERAQHVAELPHRAAVDAERTVASTSADGRAQPADLLLGDLDRVEPCACDPLRRTAELAEGVLRAAEYIRSIFGDELRSLVAPVLFVAQDEQPQRRRRAGLVGGDECGDAHRNPALHVERAAPPYEAVVGLGGE